MTIKEGTAEPLLFTWREKVPWNAFMFVLVGLFHYDPIPQNQTEDLKGHSSGLHADIL